MARITLIVARMGAPVKMRRAKMGSVQTTLLIRRRTLGLLAAAAAMAAPGRSIAQQRRFTVGFANLTDDPGARLEGLGFERVYDYVPGKADWFASGLPREGRLG